MSSSSTRSPDRSSASGASQRAPSRFSTGWLAERCANHPWRTIATWLVVVGLSVYLAQGLGDALTTEVTITNKPESVIGSDLLAARLRPFDPVSETVIIQSADLTVDDAAFREYTADTVQGLSGLAGIVDGVTDPYQMIDQSDATASGLVSADRHTLLLPVTMLGSFDDATEHGDAYISAIEGMRQDGFTLLSVGDVSADHTYGTMAEEDLQKGEAIGIPIALVVLLIVFAAVVAAGLPLILGAVAIIVALGMTAIVGRSFDLFVFVTNIITMLGLAVGIDYSLFVIARYREERRHGFDRYAAIAVAGGTASKAVLFSGMTVVFALAGMFFVPLTVFKSIGAGAILVVIAAISATLTLIPAMLGLLGDKIDWPRKHRYDHATTHAGDRTAATSGFWAAMTRVVMARPWISAVIAITLLGALCIPAFQLERGTSTVSSLPASDVKQAFQILEKDFSAGRLEPVEIVIDAKLDHGALENAIQQLSAAIAADPDFGQAPTVEWNALGDLALIQAQLAMDANSEPAYDAIARLRSDVIPGAFGEVDAKVYVTGNTAIIADYFAAVDDVTPWVFTFVLGLSFILLLVVFRSIVVPVTAIMMNLLSVGAAYGALVLVFQKGYGADFLGLQQTPNVEAWLPIFLFCILFGLSMDYHVFLLSRIREHYDLTGDNHQAVAMGLGTTARIITGAASIMVVVFAGVAAGRLVQLQELGFGLAVAVFLDATIVRSVLVPSVMTILGDRNWYLPSWLRWLPDLRIEGSGVREVRPPESTSEIDLRRPIVA